MSRLSVCLWTTALTVIVIYSWPSDKATPVVASHDNAADAASDLFSVVAAQSSRLSPFGMMPQPDQSAEERIRNRKAYMAKDGITMDERYFRMSVEELDQRGKNGDALASIQIAQRYWNEADGMQSEAGTDFSDKPHAIALRFYTMATRGGAAFIPEIVANHLYLSGENPTEAAAWDMIAQKFGSSATSVKPGPARTFRSMTYEQLNAANQRANELADEIGLSL